MAWYWLCYWISVAIVIATCFIVKNLFTIEGKNIPRIYSILLCIISFIPIIGTLEALFALIGFWVSICGEDLKLKEKPLVAKWDVTGLVNCHDFFDGCIALENK